MRDEYDTHGRLVREEITHAEGHGSIEYQYRGDTMQLVQVTCDGEFCDKARRIVFFEPARPSGSLGL